MKYLIKFFAIFYGIWLQSNPLLVAVLMVKNEAPAMETTLQPLVDAGIQDFLIYDTGSTDNTIQVTQDFFIQNNITHFVIEQGEFVDFATSRNKALELTDQYFPDATFMLMPDAEWILQNGTDLLKFCEEQKNNNEPLFMMRIKRCNMELGQARLIRTKSNVAFVGRVHEIPNLIPKVKVPDHIYFELTLTKYGCEKSQERWLKDRAALFQDLQANPDNPRTIYFLAQTYFYLNDWQNAEKWYQYRSEMSGYAEENFLSLYFLAQVYGFLGKQENMIQTYFQAFCLRPNRAEPLIRLAEYFYNMGNYELCYLFARHAATMPYPTHDFMNIEKWLYDFARYNLLSLTSFFMTNYKLGEQATLKALQACPYEQYLHQNLQQYQMMLLNQKER